jgi:hypothetical protein
MHATAHIEQAHFHGEVDRATHVQEFNDAAQRENDDPNPSIHGYLCWRSESAES